MPGIFYFMSELHLPHYMKHALGNALFFLSIWHDFFPIYPIVFV
jgi:hypothetical protein